MSLKPYENYGKVLRDSEAGETPLVQQLATVNSKSWRFDPGGWSYGMYQLATFGHELTPGPRIIGPKTDAALLATKSPFHSFLDWCVGLQDDMGQSLHITLGGGVPKPIPQLVKEAAGVSGGKYVDNKQFIDNWVKFAYAHTEWADELQSGYHAKGYYWPSHLAFKSAGIDLLKRSNALNQFVTDYANIGPGHVPNAVKASGVHNGMSDKEIILGISGYYKTLFDKFGKAQPKFAEGWANRFGSVSKNRVGKVESVCLKMLEGK